MDNRRREPKESSLPESLRPHLYDGPRQTEPLPTQQYQALSIPGQSDDLSARPRSRELPPIQSSLQLPPVPTSLLRPLADDPRLLPPPRVQTGQPHVVDASFSSHRANESHPSAILHQTGGAKSLPTHYGQHFANVSLEESLQAHGRPLESLRPARDPNLTLPIPRPAILQRGSWREGEAGPSSLIAPMSHSFESYRGRRGSSQPGPFPRHIDFLTHRAVSDDENELDLARGREGSSYGNSGHSKLKLTLVQSSRF
jgi:hypothetical protein